MSEQAKDLQEQGPDNLIELTDEFGHKALFEFLDVIEYQETEYVALLPTEGDPEAAAEVVILEIIPSEESEDEEDYVSVEDEETLTAVFDIFKKRFQDVFLFED